LVGDKDDHCLQLGLYLKQVLLVGGLAILPKTGAHADLEETCSTACCPDFWRRGLQVHGNGANRVPIRRNAMQVK
jgi:hypothetical protein